MINIESTRESNMLKPNLASLPAWWPPPLLLGGSACLPLPRTIPQKHCRRGRQQRSPGCGTGRQGREPVAYRYRPRRFADSAFLARPASLLWPAPYRTNMRCAGLSTWPAACAACARCATPWRSISQSEGRGRYGRVHIPVQADSSVTSSAPSSTVSPSVT